MTRIIAGSLRGRRIAVPESNTRPTSDRVREAVFSMLGARTDLDGATVLDLYAGSGALGFEALSRGAARAVFVDSDRRAASTITGNAKACGVLGRVQVVARDAATFLAARVGVFDVVFYDPPYEVSSDAVAEDIAALADGMLADGAFVVVERGIRTETPRWPAGAEVVVSKKYGDTRLDVLRYNAEQAASGGATGTRRAPSLRIGDLEAEVPVIGAPMAGGPTTPQLVAAVTEAGGVGTLGGGYLTAVALEPLLESVRLLTDGPFGVNLFLPDVAAASLSESDRARLEAHREALALVAARYGVEPGPIHWFDEDIDAKIELLGRHRPAFVSFTFGDPGSDLVERIHEFGALVFVTVTSPEEARAAADSGADAVIAQGRQAGGHRSVWIDDPAHPDGGPWLSTEDLLPAVLAVVDIPVVSAGGIISGAQVADLCAAGAAAVSVGTALLLTDEAGTPEVYRRALTEQAYDDTVVTRAFSGRPARGLANGFATGFIEAPAVYPYVHYVTKPIRAAATAAADPEGVALWAGAGWRDIAAGTVAEILDGLAHA